MAKPHKQIDISPTFMDRAIGVFSPNAMKARLVTRAQIALFSEQVRKYNSGTNSRRTAGWHAPGTSANAELSSQVTTLINRSREMVRNNPTAKRAVEAISDNVVGLGIRPSHYKSGGKRADKSLREAWQNFAETTSCDWDGKNTFYGLQLLAARTIAESGSVLIRMRWSRKSTVGIQYQVMEPDFIDRSKHTTTINPNNGKPYDMDGRRYDANGQLLGFWLYQMHPGDGWNGDSVFVDAEEVIHVYNVERPGQMDGVPVLTTSAMTMRDFDEYEQAQLIRQKIAACFAVFITDSDGVTPSGLGDGKPIERLEPGMIERVPSGKTVTFTTPPTVSNYDEYATSILRRIASGIGISYEVLTGDLSNVNFSSGRMGWIEFHRLIQRWQYHVLVPQMCDPMYKWFIKGCLMMGLIKAEPKGRCTWTPPRREMIDPAKEVKALIEMIRAGLKPFSEAMREMGQDPDVAIDAIIEDFKELRKYDLFLTCDPKFDATRSNGPLIDPNAGGTPDDDPDEEKTGKQLKKERALGILKE